MRISACVITKNEEKNLPRWLESMRGVADEMIVVDTGSSDGTVALAKAAGAHVSFFEWVDDFSAAKNFALDHATGDWILFLDADEYFAVKDCPKLREMIRIYHGNPEMAGLLFRRINLDRETGQDLGLEDTVIRCFRRSARFRYVGRVHEAVHDVSGAKNNMIQYVPGIVLYHTGYSPVLMEGKILRDLEILLSMQEKGEGRQADSVYLADCYYGLGEYGKAAEYARRAVAEGVELIGMETRAHAVLVHSLMLMQRPPGEIVEALGRAVERFPGIPDFWLFWGLVDWDCHDYEGAERHFRKGIGLYRAMRDGQSKEERLSSYTRNLLPSVYHCMGELERGKNHASEAAGYLLESLELNRRNPGALKACCQAMLSGDVSAEELGNALDALYNTPEDRKFLHRVLGELAMQEQGDVPRRPFESKIK